VPIFGGVELLLIWLQNWMVRLSHFELAYIPFAA